MGRNIYEEMAEFWPVSDDEYAEPMNTIPKVVFSRSLERASRTRSCIRSSPETPLPSPFKPGLTTCAPDNGRGAEGVRDDRGRGVATRGGRELRGFLDDYGPVVLPSVAPGVFRNRRNSAGSACTRSVSSYMT
jgi:hypothetical protein